MKRSVQQIKISPPPIDPAVWLQQIEVCGEQLLLQYDLLDWRTFQRSVRDFSLWAAIAEPKEADDEEAPPRYVDPLAPVLQRNIDRLLTRLQTQIKKSAPDHGQMAELIDEIQNLLREMYSFKQ
ncbi:MAG: hypothetical protein LLG09_09120 [Negativicutes bacterium]|nr:hypothetical protein [Negativicutes bacterium]